MIRYRFFNIAFDDSLAQMNRALRPAFLPLVVLANIDQVKWLARFLLVANIFGSVLANPALGIVDYLQKPWRMIHHSLLGGLVYDSQPNSRPQTTRWRVANALDVTLNF